MSTWIHNITTAVPDTAYDQQQVGQWMQEQATGDRERRILKALYRSSGIATRHSVIPGFGKDFFGRSADGQTLEPGTGERNAIYARHANHLALDSVGQLLKETPGFKAQEITHLVTVSCTGFANPGPDYHLIRELGLRPDIERYHLGFMGCYAAFPALKMADQFCRANPEAVILILCLELCTLHIQFSEREDQLLANALFADGAAAALLSSRSPQENRRALELKRFHAALVPSGEQEMTWSLGNYGFDIALSSYVPKILGAQIAEPVDHLLRRAGLKRTQVPHWAIHPGGKSIIDRVQASLDLEQEEVAPARLILNNYGNMSSPTILFVLREYLQNDSAGPICAMAFGPGLTAELALLHKPEA